MGDKHYLEKYDDIVKDLHDIINFEYTSMELIHPVISDITDMAVSFNSFGLLSAEVAEALNAAYASDRIFRRLWGSISTQFYMKLSMKYGIGPEQLTVSVLGTLNLETNAWVNEGSFTDINILGDRIGVKGYGGANLTNPNDFWIICFFLFRLTLDQSKIVVKTLADYQHMVSAPVLASKGKIKERVMPTPAAAAPK